VLLTASLFSGYAAQYAVLVNIVVCLGAMVIVQLAVRKNEYFWGAGYVAIAIAFSPLGLVVKIFLLMGFTCVAAFVTLLAAFRRQPVPAWQMKTK
jgi:hypothetical protein